MSAQRPLVTGEIVGADMLDAKELPDDKDQEIAVGRRFVDSLGQDLIEAARFDESRISRPGVKLLIDETEFTGGDFAMYDGGPHPFSTWINLPAGRIQYPHLLRNAIVEFQATGTYFNNSAVVQTLEFELMVDGVASGAVFSWPITSPLGDVGGGVLPIVVFTAALRAIHGGGPSAATIYDLEGRLVMRSAASPPVTVVDQPRGLRPTINGTAARTLGFRARRLLAQANEALFLKSHCGFQVVYRSGT